MRTLQTELTKYRTTLANIRHINAISEEEKMQTEQTPPNFNPSSYPNSVSRTRNRRYKRTHEELAMDVAKVDELVKSGKYHTIEAVEKVGMKSAVYYAFHHEQGTVPPKSTKPKRKPGKRKNKVQKDFEQRKEAALAQQQEERRVSSDRRANEETTSLRQKLAQLEDNYNKLCRQVVEKGLLKQ